MTVDLLHTATTIIQTPISHLLLAHHEQLMLAWHVGGNSGAVHDMLKCTAEAEEAAHRIVQQGKTAVLGNWCTAARLYVWLK